jgi:hypothetical protein
MAPKCMISLVFFLEASRPTLDNAEPNPLRYYFASQVSQPCGFVGLFERLETDDYLADLLVRQTR